MKGNAPVVLSHYTELVRLFPNDERAHALLGNLYFGRQDYESAIKHFVKATTINPSFSQPYNQLGYAYRFIDKLTDAEDVTAAALARVETLGIIFLDEIDKIAGERGQAGGPDVSREGVQRDLLPIVEGSNVQTKYGMVKTDHVLFVAAGAFHVSKPSDLIPELQGRFPIRVELKPLTEADFVRIMTEPENALTKQYAALVQAEGASLTFTPDGIAEIARVAAHVNDRMENIGARRLHTVMTTLLEDVLYELPDAGTTKVDVDAARVRDRLKTIVEDEDLRKYIL